MDSDRSSKDDDIGPTAEHTVEERTKSMPTTRSTARGFGGFSHKTSIDKFAPTNGIGPGLVTEATRLSSGDLEQTLTLDGLKVCVVQQQPRPDAVPKTTVTIAVAQRSALSRPKGVGFSHLDAEQYEIVYSSRTSGRKRNFTGSDSRQDTLLDAMADARSHTSRPSERGDPVAVRAALERAARLYGASAHTLVEAMKSVTAPEVSAPLASALHHG